MKLATWNSCGGDLLDRCVDLEPFSPDVAIVQECKSSLGAASTQQLWFGNPGARGVGAVAKSPYSLEPIIAVSGTSDSVYAMRVFGPVSFNLLAVWAKPDPSYVSAALDGILQFESLLESPTVILGDFNSHWRWDKSELVNHSHLIERLEGFGLVSAYHSIHGREDEIPTLYWRWQQDAKYHIDYCFVPRSWQRQLKSVVIGNYEDWAEKSDHRPLVVEVNTAEHS